MASEEHPDEALPLALAVEDCPSTETVSADASTVDTAFEVEIIGRISVASAIVEGVSSGSESSGVADVLMEDAFPESASAKGIFVDGGCAIMLSRSVAQSSQSCSTTEWRTAGQLQASHLLSAVVLGHFCMSRLA